MNSLSIKERFFQIRKPDNFKVAFLEVLSNLNGEHKILKEEYTAILEDHNITTTMDFMGLSDADNCLLFDIEQIQKLYGIAIRFPSKTIVPLVDADKTTKLIDAFNRVLVIYYDKNKLVNRPLRIYKPEYNKYFNKLIVMFDENHITDYYLYFYTLFHLRKWEYLWNFITSAWDSALSMYQQHHVTVKSLLDMANSANKQAQVEKSRWVDIFDYVENKKKFYLSRNTPEVCMNNIDVILGYHPRSVNCQNCPINTKCAQNINNLFANITKQTKISLMDLRTSLISVSDAQKQLSGFDLIG